MTKGIFLNVPAHGHINPTLPLVAQLVKNGETIIYYGLESYREKIESTGAIFRPYRLSLFQDKFGGDGTIHLASLMLKASNEVLDNHLEEIIKEKPDYIMHDSMCPWGKFIARILDVKSINTTTTLVFNGQTVRTMPVLLRRMMFDLIKKPGNFIAFKKYKAMLKKKYNIDVGPLPGIMGNYEKLNIIFTSPYFQPNAKMLDNSYKFIGPSISKREEEADISLRKLKSEGKKIIYISMGTIHNEKLTFYKKCISEFADQENHVIISVGFKTKIEDLGPIPKNIIVRNHVPQLDILQICDVFVTHGGMNSVNEALYYGVPMVMFPQQSEQLMTAMRVEKLGAGICMGIENEMKYNLVETCNKIMNHQPYYENARLISETFREAGGYEIGVEEILNYVR